MCVGGRGGGGQGQVKAPGVPPDVLPTFVTQMGRMEERSVEMEMMQTEAPQTLTSTLKRLVPFS